MISPSTPSISTSAPPPEPIEPCPRTLIVADREERLCDLAYRDVVWVSPDLDQEDVADEMRELLSEIQNVPAQNALTAAAYFHAKFENIHPFADGNGRTGRLAMNYFLVLRDHPPIVIHEEDRKGYYEALEAWDCGQELAPLRQFLQEQTAKTWQKQIAREEKRKSRSLDR